MDWTKQQKSIGRYKSHGRTTQAPIGNIVYETDDDDGDNQSNYERHDVSNIDDDIRPRNGKYSQSDAEENDNDEVEFNSQRRHKVLKTIIDLRDINDDDGDADDADDGDSRIVKEQQQQQKEKHHQRQPNEKQERERYPVVYPSATGNLMQRPTEMTHKNWGKWKIEISFAYSSVFSSVQCFWVWVFGIIYGKEGNERDMFWFSISICMECVCWLCVVL